MNKIKFGIYCVCMLVLHSIMFIVVMPFALEVMSFYVACTFVATVIILYYFTFGKPILLNDFYIWAHE